MEIIVNGQAREAAEGITIADLLAELQLNDKPVAVEIVTLVGGG